MLIPIATAVVLQEGKPVAFGSVYLTHTQQQNTEIENELLAVVYGLENFIYYTNRTDVKAKKGSKAITLSEKEMILSLLVFNRCYFGLVFTILTLEYLMGKQLLIADAVPSV